VYLGPMKAEVFDAKISCNWILQLYPFIWSHFFPLSLFTILSCNLSFLHSNKFTDLDLLLCFPDSRNAVKKRLQQRNLSEFLFSPI